MTDQEKQQATERLAAENILQRGVKIKIGAPFFLRWFGKKTITARLTSPYLGTMHRVSAYYLSTGIKEEQLEELSTEEAIALMSIHGKTIAKAVACALLNSYWKGKFFTRLVGWYLRWHCKPRELFALTQAILVYGGAEDFMSTTRSVRAMKITSPKMGQKPKGS